MPERESWGNSICFKFSQNLVKKSVGDSGLDFLEIGCPIWIRSDRQMAIITDAQDSNAANNYLDYNPKFGF